MEVSKSFPFTQNGSCAKIFERTDFSEHDVRGTHSNGVHKFPNTGGVDCKKKQQQEDRILYRQVPKKILDDIGAALYHQPSFKLLDLDFDRKLRDRLLPAGDGRPALSLDLESPVSQISSLSECSSICADSPTTSTTLDEEDLCPDLGCSMVQSPTKQPSSAKSSEGSTVLEILTNFPQQSEVSTEAVVTPLNVKLTEQNGDEGITGEKRRKPHSGSFCEEDKEFEFLKVPKVRRRSSVRSPSSSDSLCRKKEVRFADVLGLDLESVKHITATNEPPAVPLKVLRDLRALDKPDDVSNNTTIKQVLHLWPCFTPPGSSGTFSKRVREQKVVLDTLIVDDVDFSVTGSVCVLNIAYVKHVFIRFTTNGWLSQSDVEAAYIRSSNESQVDRFLFKVNLPRSFGFGNRLEFAICYESVNQVYWDNNFKSNYRVECCYTQVS